MKYPVFILRIFLVIMLHILIIGCKKCPEDKLQNKIKRILFDNNGLLLDIRYSYNQISGKLIKVYFKDEIYVFISDINNNTITLKYSDTALSSPLQPINRSFDFYAHLSSFSYLEYLEGRTIDSFSIISPIQKVANYFSNNQFFDSITINQLLNPLLKDQRIYNIDILNNNTLEFTYDYSLLNFYTGNFDFFSDQIKYFYTTNYTDTKILPCQFAEKTIFTLPTYCTDPEFLLKINGNQRSYLDNFIVDSVQVLQGGDFKTDRIYKYTYQYNKIVKMRIEKQAVDFYQQFDIEYY